MQPTRRTLIHGAAASAAVLAVPALGAKTAPANDAPPGKRIPSSGEEIPAVGLGSWITFNVGDDPRLRA